MGGICTRRERCWGQSAPWVVGREENGEGREREKEKGRGNSEKAPAVVETRVGEGT